MPSRKTAPRPPFIQLVALACLLTLPLAGCNDNPEPLPGDVFPLPPADRPTPAPEARVIALSRDGEIASLDINPPWRVMARESLGAAINSIKCRAGICGIVHPDPVNALSLVNAQTLQLIKRIDLGKGSDPRDLTFTSDRTVVVSLFNQDYLLELDTRSEATRRIALPGLPDGDGLPESNMLASCGKQVYLQAQRLDHETGLPSKQPPVIAVIDTWNRDRVRRAEVSLTPALDIQADCQARELTVAQPKSIIEGGGTVEFVNLKTGRVSPALAEGEFANGGILKIAPGLYWVNQHTDTGPGPSSHLSLVGGDALDVYNVFANEHVDNFAHDRVSGWLFYPNPCSTLHTPACGNGIHVFHGLSGVSAGDSIDPGFAPIEVTVSR